MNEPFGQLRLLLTGPVLCALVLAAIMVDNRRYRSDADYDAFHRRAKAAVASIPLSIGPWVGRDEELTREELNLLRPNAYRCVVFSDTRAEALGDPSRHVRLLIDQCRRASDMSGHYPPVCYPSRGDQMVDAPPGKLGRERWWTAGGVKLRGTEYFFEGKRDTAKDGGQGGTYRLAVYDFMILPQQGVRPDMESVVASAEDYQQRDYGAAQVQLVFGGGLARATPQARKARDKVLQELLGPCSNVLTTLSDGVIDHE